MRLFLLFLILLTPNFAMAAKRMALIIGNDAYSEVVPLQKAAADAKAVATRLEGVGFETMLGIDLKRRDFNLMIANFTAKLSPSDTAFVFFAGHGVEINGENLLLPTDIAAPADASADFVTSESIALSALLDRVRRTGARTTLAVIDACRDNPFPSSNGRSIGRSRGLGRIAAPEGTFVLFSAGAGQQALDRLNDQDASQNSVFTRLLLPKLEQPNLELRDLISTLRVEVRDLAQTQNHAQFPAYYDELLGDFYFQTASLQPARKVVSDAAPAPKTSEATIRDDFALAREIGTASALKAFLSQHEGSADFSIALAQDMLSKLNNTSPPTREAASKSAPENKPELALAPTLKTDPENKRSVEEERAAQKELIRKTQQQLDRLGCRPGGADGIAGRRTRDAFKRFLSTRGTALDAGDLGSQAALNILVAAKAPACKAPEPVKTAAKPKTTNTTSRAATSSGIKVAAGSWTYHAKCPMFIRATGKTTIRITGAKTFVSSGSDNLGLSGQLTYTIEGTTLKGVGVWGGNRVTESGTIAANGRSYSVRSNFGCKVTARKN